MLKNQADDETWQCSFCGDLVPKKELMTHLNYCLKAADLIMGIKCTECHQDQFKSKHEVYGHILEGFLETHDANVQFEVRGAAENHREIEQGKTTINEGALLIMPPRSILQNQGKTKVLPVLPTTTPLKVNMAMLKLSTVEPFIFRCCTEFIKNNISLPTKSQD